MYRRDAKASGDAAETAAASLKLQLVRLLLRHITALQQEHEPLAVLMSLHAQAVSLVKESVTQLMAAGADMKRIEAVLLQVHVMQHNPCPHDLAADDRQALLDYIQLLQVASICMACKADGAGQQQCLQTSCKLWDRKTAIYLGQHRDQHTCQKE